MLLTLATLTLLALPLQDTDSTVPVQRGQRLEVNVFGGEVNVRTWDRASVRVQASFGSRGRVEIARSGTTVSVRTSGRRGSPASADVDITMPAWLPISVAGIHTDISITGVAAAVSAESVEGNVDVTGGDGIITLRSVQGSVVLAGGKGRIELHSVNEDVSVERSSGDFVIETVNGNVALLDLESGSVDATTVNGDIEYDGTIRNGGRYAFSTHNGDISVGVPAGTNASVRVATFNGDFESDFPVTLNETRKGRRFSFTVGSGGAQVTLESFQGTIRLARPDRSRRRR